MDLEAMAAALEASGNYRILRKLIPRAALAPLNGASFKTALFVDVETTGLDPGRDEIIELAMIPFTYGVDGQIFSTLEPLQALQQPQRPISAEITAITGVTNEMVQGKEIDTYAVETMVAKADLIIAHNANFDRRFLERFSPISKISRGLVRLNRSTGNPRVLKAPVSATSLLRRAISMKSIGRSMIVTPL